jgi:hypothetical protein
MKKLICLLLALPLMVVGQEVKKERSQGERPVNHQKITRMEAKPAREGVAPTGRSETRTDVRTESRIEGRHVFGNKSFYRHSFGWRPERHDRDFYVHRYGGDRLRIINGGWYYYENGCWIAAVGYDPNFGTYTEYEICPGDPLYVDIDIN